MKTASNLVSSSTLVFKCTAEFMVLYCYFHRYSSERKWICFCSPQLELAKKSNLNKFERVSTPRAPLHPTCTILFSDWLIALIASSNAQNIATHCNGFARTAHENCCSSFHFNILLRPSSYVVFQSNIMQTLPSQVFAVRSRHYGF